MAVWGSLTNSCVSEVIDISPSNLDSSLCFFQSSVSHEVLCPGIKIIPMEKKCKKTKWLSGEALQIAVKRKEDMGEFPGSPVVRTQPYHCQDPGLDPWLGN